MKKRLFSLKTSPKKPPEWMTKNKDLSFLTLYGTQLGQAKSIAEDILNTAQTYGLNTIVLPLNELKEIDQFGTIEIPIVIVTSTTGDGEPPETADKFYRKLHRKTVKPGSLHGITYAILGLGDTNFNNFCNCGKQIHKRLQELGANTFYTPVWADDAVPEADTVIESWLDGLWEPLANKLGKELSIMDADKNTTSLTLPACPESFLKVKFVEGEHESRPINKQLLDPPQPYPLIDGEVFQGKITNSKILTNEGALKTTLEVTISFEGNLDFEPGDAIALIAPNPETEVEELLQRLKLQDKCDKLIELELKSDAPKGKLPAFLPKSGTKLRDLFLHYLDIRSPPKKIFLRILAEFATDDSEKFQLLELSSRQGAKKYESTIRTPNLSLLDILLTFPSCEPSVESIFENLGRLVPRSYSIASSPLTQHKSFTFGFNIIEIPKDQGRKYSRYGVCTGYLYNLINPSLDQEKSLESSLKSLTLTETTASNIIPFYKRKNHYFRLPIDNKSPVIMVGPGTGVAPFIGFIEHRAYQREKQGKEIEPLTLYFGCRNEKFDYIYQNVLETYKNDGVLKSLNVCFSRDPEQNGIKYVQDLLELHKAEVVDTILNGNGYLYVCGDARNMAKDVRERLIMMIQAVQGISEKDATDTVMNLIKNKQYLQDIWT